MDDKDFHEQVTQLKSDSNHKPDKVRDIKKDELLAKSVRNGILVTVLLCIIFNVFIFYMDKNYPAALQFYGSIVGSIIGGIIAGLFTINEYK